MADKDKRIQLKAKEIIAEFEAELIDFRLFFSGGKHILRCIVDYPQGGIILDTCSAINKKLFSYLSESNTLGGDWVVEVNSPGLDRPLKILGDFIKVKGKVIFLWLHEPVLGKEYLEAKVVDADRKALSLEYKENTVKIPWDKIKVGKEKITL